MKSFARRQFGRIEVASLNCAGSAFAPHFHDEFVLSVNIRGSERIRLDNRALEAGERDINVACALGLGYFAALVLIRTIA